MPDHGEVSRQPTPPPGVLRRSFRSTVGRESTTFGFSIMVTVAFGVTQSEHGSPGAFHLFLYAFGAVMSFAVLEGLLSGGFRREMPQHRTRVVAFGTGLNLLSVLAAIAAALAVASVVHAGAAWALTPFCAGVVYLTLESLEVALGERVLFPAHEDAAEVEG